MDAERYSSVTCWKTFSKPRMKPGDSPKLSTFCKVMIGKKFDVNMALPPTFSKTQKSVVGKKVCLEDCNGKKWDVLLSNENGALVFQKGWCHFVHDHGIELGDFLVFFYFTGSHFLVEIYGIDGCLKILPGKGTGKNRIDETTGSSISRKRPRGSFHEESAEQSARKKHFGSSAFSGKNLVTPRTKTVHHNMMIRNVPIQRNIHKRSQVSRVAGTMEDPCLITGRDPNFVVEDDRDHLFDLSAFETQVKKSSIDKDENSAYRQDLFGTEPSSETVQHSETCMPDRNLVIDISDGEDYLVDLPVSDIRGNEDDNVSGKHQLCGNLCCEESDKFHNVQKSPIPERNTDALSGHKFAPISSSSPTTDLSVNSITPMKIIYDIAASKISAPSGGKMKQSKQDSREFKQEVCSSFSGEQSNANLGKTSTHEIKVKDGSMRPIKQESRELKHVEDSKIKVKNEADVKTIAKPEPMDCDTPSGIASRLACLPRDNERILQQPENLPDISDHIEDTQQLATPEHSAGRLSFAFYRYTDFKVSTNQLEDDYEG